MTQSGNMQQSMTNLPSYGVQAHVGNSPSSNPYSIGNHQYNVQQNPNTYIGYTDPSPNPAPSHKISNSMSNTQSPLPSQHPTIAPPNYIPVCVGNNSVQHTQTGFSGPECDMSSHQHIISTDTTSIPVVPTQMHPTVQSTHVIQTNTIQSESMPGPKSMNSLSFSLNSHLYFQNIHETHVKSLHSESVHETLPKTLSVEKVKQASESIQADYTQRQSRGRARNPRAASKVRAHSAVPYRRQSVSVTRHNNRSSPVAINRLVEQVASVHHAEQDKPCGDGFSPTMVNNNNTVKGQ
ncbi:putative uncharacterized protein DDB_G0290521 [Ruditapes philippinarum]|uniref:putative uncharacterized protein DDB_G0290521 n=1 Tax=Ruditapes philippinarum TaxID=129788 RepID=UPI00295B8C58|nr:putative uncharacterized protein DDB_G0290521 [Ruditapes philippinarum]